VTAKVLQKWIAKAQRRAGLRATGEPHILRHTFCSHLAMRGATALSIQQLAGHENMQTTLIYMHLTPGEKERAISLLNQRGRGGIGAAPVSSNLKQLK
jgi:site-specific recombinase XerD